MNKESVCSQIHTKHINTLCGQNIDFLNLKLAVHIVTTGLCRSKQLVFMRENLCVHRGAKPEF